MGRGVATLGMKHVGLLVGVVGAWLVAASGGCDVEPAEDAGLEFRAQDPPGKFAHLACGTSIITTEKINVWKWGTGDTVEEAKAACEASWGTNRFGCQRGKCLDAGGTGCVLDVSAISPELPVPSVPCKCHYETYDDLLIWPDDEPLDLDFDPFEDCPQEIEDPESETLLARVCMPIYWARAQVMAGLADSDKAALQEAFGDGEWVCEGLRSMPPFREVGCSECCIEKPDVVES